MYECRSGRHVWSGLGLWLFLVGLGVSLSAGQALAQSNSSAVANRSAGSGFGDALGARIVAVTEKVPVEEKKRRFEYEAWISGNYNRTEFEDNGSSLDQDLYIATLAGGTRIDGRFIVGGALAYGLSVEDSFQKTSGTRVDGETDAVGVALYGGFLATENLLLDVLALRLFLDNEQDQIQNGAVTSTSQHNTNAWVINFGTTYADVVGAYDYGLKADFQWSRFDQEAFTDSAGNATAGSVDAERKLTLTADAGYTIGNWHPNVVAGYEYSFDPVRDGVTDSETDADGFLFGAGVDYTMGDYVLSLQTAALAGNSNLDAYEAILTLKGRF